MGYFVNLGQWRESVASSYGSQSEDQPLSRPKSIRMHRLLLRDSAGLRRPPRIALIGDRFDGGGGAEMYARDLGNWLASRGCDVHVIARTIGAVERRLPVAFHEIAAHPRQPVFARDALACAAAIEADVTHDMGVAAGCDIFHSHVGSPLACQQAAEAAHAAWYRPLRRVLYGASRHRRLQAQAAIQFGAPESLFIALSRRGAADLTSLHGVSPARIRLVPNGVNAEQFDPATHRDAGAAIRRQCGFAPDDIVVIGVAHNRRLKGTPMLTRAVLQLRREGLPVKLLLCGRPRTRGSVPGAPVFEAGCVADMAAHYAAADIAVQPTFYDACSLATLESLASGLPVVTTRANGASELLASETDSIVLDDAADVTALTATLRRLASDRWLRASLGRTARRRAIELGSDAAFASIVAVYGEVVASRDQRLLSVGDNGSTTLRVA
jgi:UDP-glucose:(heptosyl)LPS alpha-1,3-glucosyltransferase